jgi:hypothetical protein
MHRHPRVNIRICRISRASSGMMWPCRGGTASMRNLSQRPTEASSRPVTPDRRKVGLEVSSIDSVTLSDGDSRENAHTPADLHSSRDRLVAANRARERSVLCAISERHGALTAATAFTFGGLDGTATAGSRSRLHR